MRWKTKEVKVGRVGVGGDNPIRLQSMTTSPTRDVEATVEEVLKLEQVGCEIVRVTVQGIKEAEACENIRNSLIQKNCTIPLVADIHFFPPAALKVAPFVDKVRINPGNFAEKRASLEKIEMDNATYERDLQRIEEKFTPLVELCKKQGKAIRIGTNHGSLSDRILSTHGDTPNGMVIAAIEYAEVARKLDYHDFIFSMKSSNPLVMVAAYRLLVQEMIKRGWNYPLHLGVTEAGEGEDGRVKSAMGIGTLLQDGIGDTIRVSLTEPPWQELDPCRRLRDFTKDASFILREPLARRQVSITPPLHRDGSVIGSDFKQEPISLKNWEKEKLFYRGELPLIEVADENDFESLKGTPLLAVSVTTPLKARQLDAWLRQEQLKIPLLLHFSYSTSVEDLVIQASAQLGSLLLDGIGDGIGIQGPYDEEFLHRLSFAILQAARRRNVKTDFISCPGCGRTLFPLQEVSKQIREKTAHLPGVKVAIMGCIVNGPGEMADADFGYVGSKTGMVDLYIGKTCIEKDVPSVVATDRLVSLIKSEGRWQDPPASSL
jgi:(E)-4-hydroxy-3-methylbut-2-enyl-diphosphate synthase